MPNPLGRPIDSMPQFFQRSTIRCLITHLLFSLFVATSVRAATPHRSAIVPRGNDLPWEDEPRDAQRVRVPQEVQTRIDQIVDSARKTWIVSFGNRDVGPKSSAYGSIYRFSVPDGWHLYFFCLVNPVGFTTHFLIVFDPSTRALTKNPPALWGKWTDLERTSIAHGNNRGDLLQRPIISFDDLDQDGQPEIIIQEVVHNGTMYNAVVYYYFHLGRDLSLNQVMALETRVVDLYTPNEEGRIVREIKKQKPTELLLETFAVESSGPSARRRVGEVVLRSTGPGKPFAVAERRPIDKKYAWALVTASGEKDENKFLLKGYAFWY